MVTVVSGVNELNLDLKDQSLCTVRHRLSSTLGLSGSEKTKVNGSETANGEYIIKDGDRK
jgi:hypothetical protein